MFYVGNFRSKRCNPITNYCTAIRILKNVESNSVNSIGIKSLLGPCDVQVEDKTGYKSFISIDEGSFRFFNDLEKISCNFKFLFDDLREIKKDKKKKSKKKKETTIQKKTAVQKMASVIIPHSSTYSSCGHLQA
jgi:hypothetical protein